MKQTQRQQHQRKKLTEQNSVKLRIDEKQSQNHKQNRSIQKKKHKYNHQKRKKKSSKLYSDRYLKDVAAGKTKFRTIPVTTTPETYTEKTN